MIEVEGLSKYYGAHAAIRNLRFSIAQGEVVGFVGLNGAGKTTTLKILACLSQPTSGRAVVDGLDIAVDAHGVRRKIGFLPDTPPLYNEMTVGAFLALAAGLRGVPPADRRRAVIEAEERTALRHKDTEPIASLSHGYRQRVGVAQAIVHKPKLLIMDEPTSGLDPVQIVEMRGLIRDLRGAHTILVSSHILAEISQVCDRLLVIQAGEIVAQGTESDLARHLGRPMGDVEVDVCAPAERALEIARGIPDAGTVEVVRQVDGVVTLRIEATPDLRPRIGRAFMEAGVDLLRLDKGAARLESIFISLTKTAGDHREASS